MRFLKQSTSVDVPIGPFLDATDAVTAETGLTVTQPDIRLKKNGGAWAQKNAAQTLSHEENGYYEVTLDATDTDTLGLLRLAVHESGALPVWEDFMVMPANVWDSLFGADRLQVHAAEITNGLITADAIATGAVDADALAADAVTEIQSGLALQTSVDTLEASAAAIEADTQDIQSRLPAALVSGRMDSNVQAMGTDVITSTALAASAVTEIQSGLALQTSVDTLEASAAAIEADTQDIQSRLPAALTAAGNMKADVLAISGSTESADRLERSTLGVVTGTVGSAATTTSIPTSSLSPAASAADQFKGRIVTFDKDTATAALRGQSTDITANTSGGTLSVSALTAAPASGDTFVIT